MTLENLRTICKNESIDTLKGIVKEFLNEKEFWNPLLVKSHILKGVMIKII